jgi:hypothetical protein
MDQMTWIKIHKLPFCGRLCRAHSKSTETARIFIPAAFHIIPAGPEMGNKIVKKM